MSSESENEQQQDSGNDEEQMTASQSSVEAELASTSDEDADHQSSKEDLDKLETIADCSNLLLDGPILWVNEKDRPKKFVSVIEKYGAAAGLPKDEDFSWKLALEEKPFKPKDIVAFVKALSFFKDSRMLYRHGRNPKYMNIPVCPIVMGHTGISL